MIILGLILLVIVAIFGAAVVVSNPGVHEPSVFRVLIPVTYGGIFFTGVGATVLALLAVLLLRLGLRRARVTRKERRQLDTGPAGSAGREAKADAEVAGGTAEAKSDDPRRRRRRASGSPSAPASAPSLDVETQGSSTKAERRAMVEETTTADPRRPVEVSFFEIFQPGLKHLREEKDRQKMLVSKPTHGGGAPLGIDLDGGTARISIRRPPPASEDQTVDPQSPRRFREPSA